MPPPALSDFVVGANDEILTAVRALAERRSDESSIYIWGDAGAGKSCLLAAAARHARACGLPTYYVKISPPDAAPVPPPVEGLLAVDNINLSPPATQITLFDWHNHASAHRRQYLLATGDAAPNELPIREELATRLSGGMVFRLLALDDEQKQRALASYAQRRGFHLPPEVARLLLSRLPRNMHSLEAALNDLDNFLLTRQKPLTSRRVAAWLMSRMPQLRLEGDGESESKHGGENS